MRLGGPLFDVPDNPEAWARAVQAKGYRAAFCPVGADADDATVSAFRDAAARADIVIAECGSWCNPLAEDSVKRDAAIEKCRRQLALADRIDARCCVNIAGSRGEKWDGPCALDLTEETFGMIVESVRSIIDVVKPTRTFYTLETMPWMYPDSVESYERLLAAIDRKAFGVHFDPVNLVCSPQIYFNNAALISSFCERLGHKIRSCHAKDIHLADKLTTQLTEVGAGQGALDYAVYLHELHKLEQDTPLMLEHLRGEEEYDQAAAYVRQVAETEGIAV